MILDLEVLKAFEEKTSWRSRKKGKRHVEKEEIWWILVTGISGGRRLAVTREEGKGRFEIKE